METNQSVENNPNIISKEKVAPQLSVPVAIIFAGIIVGISVFLSGYMNKNQVTNPAPVNSNTPAAVSVNIKDVTMDNEPYIGNPNAPALAYFSDYQCPFCKKFDESILSDLKKNYVDTGKLKIVFKDFAFLGADSITDATFAYSVWNLYPNKYFDWREAMFNAQDGENTGFGDKASVEKLTKTISGIDEAKVAADVNVNGDKYKKLIDASTAEGQKLGVQGTPSVIVGAVMIGGFDQLSSYKAAIDKVVK